MNAITYRRDIDGLRSVAVLSVFLYHLNANYLPGGFVGVDIFFVISGFLITKILVKHIQTQSFSLVGFYSRRFRRILPALLVTLIAGLVAGYFIYTPNDLVRLGDQSMFAAFGLSNFYFLQHSDYFAPAAHTQPMLHTWSLAVEEQFYLFWPLLLFGISKFAPRKFLSTSLIVLAIGALLSYGFSIYLTPQNSAAAFYMLPTRVWELALGALVGFAPAMGRVKALIMDLVGLALIGLSFLFLTSAMAFPGWVAMVPCAGTALLLWAKSDQSLVGRALSLSPLVWIGKWSYSLYLIHWPVIVFFRSYNFGAPPDHLESAVILVASIALSAISYFIIEQPFRRARQAKATASDSRSNLKVVAISVGAMAICSGAGFALTKSNGFGKEISVDAEHYLSFITSSSQRGGTNKCYQRSSSVLADFNYEDCLKASDGRPRAIVFGDSFAQHWERGLEAVFPEIQFSHMVASGCIPVLPIRGRDDCVQFNEDLFDTRIPDGNFDIAILSARWNEESAERVGVTVEYLKQYVDKVIILGRGPLYEDKLPLLLVKSAEAGGRESIILTTEARNSSARVNEILAEQTAAAGGEYYSPFDLMCERTGCTYVTPENSPMQHDYGHFTKDGAIFMLKNMRANGMLEEEISETE
ncbi:acyltransferase family protein [Ponticaulis profundi]|uniref:Acyltransferase family protein n=1 Tax=Ponticaulis profundi TaxID=2665222 RepID=A0ABW1SBE0_9PROT